MKKVKSILLGTLFLLIIFHSFGESLQIMNIEQKEPFLQAPPSEIDFSFPRGTTSITGNVEITIVKDELADIYTIYRHIENITEDNIDNAEKIATINSFSESNYRYWDYELQNGIYYYMVNASNGDGQSLFTCKSILVNKTINVPNFQIESPNTSPYISDGNGTTESPYIIKDFIITPPANYQSGAGIYILNYNSLHYNIDNITINDGFDQNIFVLTYGTINITDSYFGSTNMDFSEFGYGASINIHTAGAVYINNLTSIANNSFNELFMSTTNIVSYTEIINSSISNYNVVFGGYLSTFQTQIHINRTSFYNNNEMIPSGEGLLYLSMYSNIIVNTTQVFGNSLDITEGYLWENIFINISNFGDQNNLMYFNETFDLGNYYWNYTETYPLAENNGEVWDTPYLISGAIYDNYPLYIEDSEIENIFSNDVLLSFVSFSNENGVATLNFTSNNPFHSIELYRENTPINSLESLTPYLIIKTPSISEFIFTDSVIENGIYYYKANISTIYSSNLTNEITFESEMIPSIILMNYHNISTNGNITMIWESLRADSFLVAYALESFAEINDAIFISNELISEEYQFSNLDDGIYYINIYAINEYGNSSDSYVYEIKNLPLFTSLTVNLNEKEASITWVCENAIAYRVFYTQNPNSLASYIEIGSISDSNSRTIELNEGTWYFIVIAQNSYGQNSSIMSSSITISEDIADLYIEKEQEQQEDEDTNRIPLELTPLSYSLLILGFGLLFTLLIYIKRKS